MSDCERLRRRYWTCGAPACYPFHRREREVNAALWIQPHAVYSTLGPTPPKPSLGCRETSPTLERAGQQVNPTSGPTHSTKPTSAHLNAPTRVTSSRYLTRRSYGFLPPLFKKWFCSFPWRCGIARCCFKFLL